MGDTAATDSYRVLLSGGEGEIVEKKSRFIATIRKCETEEEAVAFIEEMKKKYWDARHNCSAFIIGSRGELTRCSDDGEPSGTAGRPMLEVLTGSGIRNIAVVVTRYFGGTSARSCSRTIRKTRIRTRTTRIRTRTRTRRIRIRTRTKTTRIKTTIRIIRTTRTRIRITRIIRTKTSRTRTR